MPIRKACIARDGGKCIKCGSVEGLSVHHRLSIYEGGDHALENLALLCSLCHHEWHLIEMYPVVDWDAWVRLPTLFQMIAKEHPAADFMLDVALKKLPMARRGVERAVAAGRKIGRRRQEWPLERIVELREAGKTYSEIGQELGMNWSTVNEVYRRDHLGINRRRPVAVVAPQT